MQVHNSDIAFFPFLQTPLLFTKRNCLGPPRHRFILQPESRSTNVLFKGVQGLWLFLGGTDSFFCLKLSTLLKKQRKYFIDLHHLTIEHFIYIYIYKNVSKMWSFLTEEPQSLFHE